MTILSPKSAENRYVVSFFPTDGTGQQFWKKWKYLGRLCSCDILWVIDTSTTQYCVLEERRTYSVHCTHGERTVRSVSTVRSIWCGAREKIVWNLISFRFFWATESEKREASPDPRLFSPFMPSSITCYMSRTVSSISLYFLPLEG